MIDIKYARFPADKAAVLDIWREYVASPSVSLAHQNNEAEFADLPGKYALPDGCILLACVDGSVAGTIAMKRATPSICEMKRMYVQPHARGLGLGRQLAERLITHARDVGYQEIRLDVLAEFRAARRLYQSLGFSDAEPVSFNPLLGTSFWGLRL